MEKIYYIYMIECSNAAYYTGYTTDIIRRYNEHEAGSIKCKYTRSFPPVRLAACWQIFSEKSKALQIEYSIKQRSKAKKQCLVEQPVLLVKEFTELSLYSPSLSDECDQ